MEREQFSIVIFEASQSSVILAGDSHDSWLSNLYNNKDKFVGIEIGAPSITSPNSIDTFGEKINKIEDGFIQENRDLEWINGKNKGYVQLAISNVKINVKYHYVSTVKSKKYKALQPFNFTIDHNQPLKS
jgi:Phosphodiesterase/alkaline phosphatase D